jgi:hypothetical protein
LWTRVARLDVLRPGTLRQEETQSRAQSRLQEHTPLIAGQRARTCIACVTHSSPPFSGCSSSRGSRYIMGCSPLSRVNRASTRRDSGTITSACELQHAMSSILQARSQLTARDPGLSTDQAPFTASAALGGSCRGASHDGVRRQMADNHIALDTIHRLGVLKVPQALGQIASRRGDLVPRARVGSRCP